MTATKLKTYVDGCVYTWCETSFANHDIIYVKDVDGNKVASAYIEHDVEQIFINWHTDVDSHTEGEYPYFEYDGDDEELVRWMVSCHPG